VTRLSSMPKLQSSCLSRLCCRALPCAFLHDVAGLWTRPVLRSPTCRYGSIGDKKSLPSPHHPSR
jgi:hypothetical protein